MRVLFLDIDGVLNGPENWGNSGMQAITPAKVKKVSDFVEEQDLQVVISSTWRVKYGLRSLQEMLAASGFQNPLRIIDVTPILNRRRQDEILVWLQGKPAITNYVILDDDTAGDGDWTKVEDHFVYVAMFTGITDEDIQRARDILVCEVYEPAA